MNSGLAAQRTSSAWTWSCVQDGPVTQVGAIRVFPGIDILPSERKILLAKVVKIGECELGAAVGHLPH